MDYMEQSTLHIKAPHEIHIGAKVMAAQRRTSMNQYVVDLIKADMKNSSLPPASVKSTVESFETATPKQKKVIAKAAQVLKDVTKKDTLSNLREAGLIEPASEAKCKGAHYTSRKDCGKPGCPWGGIK